MNDKIKSILPVSSSRAERVVDSVGGDMLAAVSPGVIRDVKNPDCCPAVLLPWLAWEASVDTWNDHWTEDEKRAAIKRAPYIHRHRGTKAALTESLTDSPFRSRIIEWYEQTPPGKPYTFRLNIEQKDMPVLMRDHQDLKHAVLRAKNLRSWFSIHIYGNCRGTAYGYGYITATEKITGLPVPQIRLSPDALHLSPGEEAGVTVTVVPPSTFTASVEDPLLAEVSVSGELMLVTALHEGQTTIAVATPEGGRAVLPVSVTAAESVVTVVLRAGSREEPVFFVDAGESGFTVDYGDGPGTAFTVTEGEVRTTRQFSEGEVLTLTIRNSETVRFFSPSATVKSWALLEIIRVSGQRRSMSQFANTCSSLSRIHEGAFEHLPYVEDFSQAFRGCRDLSALPERLFLSCPRVRSFSHTFYGCHALKEIPPDLFAAATEVETFDYVFYSCGLERLPEGLFSAAAKASNFSRALAENDSLTALPEGLFRGASGALTFDGVFAGCSRLTHLPENLFAGLSRARSFYRAFQLSGLTELPGGLFRDTAGVVFEEVFDDCASLVSVPDSLFDMRTLPETPQIVLDSAFSSCKGLKTIGPQAFSRIASGILSCRDLFSYCHGLTSVPDRLLAGMHNCQDADGVFRSCSNLHHTGDEIFRDAGVTELEDVFEYCKALEYTGNRLFAGCQALKSVKSLFYRCSALVSVGNGMFSGCGQMTRAYNVFSNTALAQIPADTFQGCRALESVDQLFIQCAALTALPEGIFVETVVTSLERAFSGCLNLQSVPPDFIVPQENTVSLRYTFEGCTSLNVNISTLFTAVFPRRSSIVYVFKNCSSVTGSRSAFLANFPDAWDDGAFENCDRLEE
ncbi:phage tail protein I [Escherichia albertii]|uniref:phage tail protein I n=1 Tax=Escherichia albertii TaxID=208962 RepID=UPI000CF6D78E|nr:phage tail protein I [Escherichia albertii]EFB5187749.1 phage tail protein I [Escherichia albertii]